MIDAAAATGIVIELVRTFKSMTMYPSGHPSRERFFERLLADFTSILARDQVIEFKVKGDSIHWSGKPLVTKDGSARILAQECFERQISTVRFTRGLTAEDIAILLEILTMEVEAVRGAGGVVDLLRGKGSGSLQLEQVDYEGILGRRVENAGDRSSHYGPETISPVSPPVGSMDLEAMTPSFPDAERPEISHDEWIAIKLRELDAADSAARFRTVLRDLITSLRETGGLGMPQYTTTVLKHLGRYLLKQVPEEISKANMEAISTLAQPAAIEGMVAQLTMRDQPDRTVIEAILLQTQNIALPVLLRCLAEESELFGRRAIIGVLGKFGGALKPHLEKWLRDDRWYVVRNALGLLQEVGGQQESANVSTFLEHPHPKIRLEALRFLNRYPIQVDRGIMNRLLEDEDLEVQARAVHALGVLMGSDGLQRLITLAKKPFFGEGDVVRREIAIKGIGRVGGEKSVQFLGDLLGTRSLIDSEGNERIQKAAVDALVEIGGPRTVYVFRRSLSRLKGQALRSVEEFLRKEGREE